MRLTWAQPEDLVAHELVQAAAEGVDVADVRRRWVAVGGSAQPEASGASDDPAAARLRDVARDLLNELDALAEQHRRAFATATGAEPEDFDDILAQSTGGRPNSVVAAADLASRVHGAWLGRAAGCLLGKPVEKIPRAGIEQIARATANWPITGYFTAVGLPPAVAARWPWNRRSRLTSLAENIAGMPEDDDLNFSMLALSLLETHGSSLRTQDVAEAWLASLPAGRVFTAERAAYRNLLDAVPVERAAVVRNPFREWIGALIRADVYGWAHPGGPHTAARLAYRDARLSHRRNGVYGAMFVAAMCATAVVASDVTAVIEAGLSVVPPRSALAAAVHRGVALGNAPLSPDAALDILHDEYGQLHWVHVLNNVALIAYALTASRGDFAPAIGLAVAGGWDTDSDAATVGSICGALAGAHALPDQWTKPLANTIASSMPGFDGIAIDELARRTLGLAQQPPS